MTLSRMMVSITSFRVRSARYWASGRSDNPTCRYANASYPYVKYNCVAMQGRAKMVCKNRVAWYGPSTFSPRLGLPSSETAFTDSLDSAGVLSSLTPSPDADQGVRDDEAEGAVREAETLDAVRLQAPEAGAGEHDVRQRRGVRVRHDGGRSRKRRPGRRNERNGKWSRETSKINVAFSINKLR